MAVRVGEVRRAARLVRPPATLLARQGLAAERRRLFVAVAHSQQNCAVTIRVQGQTQVVPPEPGWREMSSPKAPAGLIEVAVDPAGDCASTPLVAVSEVELWSVARAALKPNVILIVLDTLRRDHLDCDAASARLTPRLADSWCRHGVFYRSAFATAPWTYPSLASMMTGLMPSVHGGNGINGNARDFDPHVPTLAEILRWSGYHTHSVLSNWQASRGLWRGFDSSVELFPYLGRGRPEERRADVVVDRALAWLDEDAREPFFLWLLFIDLHEPVDAARKLGVDPPECQDIKDRPYRWEGLGQPSDPPTRGQTGRLRCREALYRVALGFIDQELARLTEQLARRGLADHTSIVLVSDHGEELWDHAAAQARAGEKPHGQWGIGHGHTLYAELVHVPLLVVEAGGAAGQQDVVVSAADVFSTVLGLARVAPPAATASRDLRHDTAAPHVVSESTAYGPARWAVTTSSLRAIRTAPDRLVVFDRARDPAEREPLGAEAPLYGEGVRLLDTALRAPARFSPPTESDREALRALGYVH